MIWQTSAPQSTARLLLLHHEAALMQLTDAHVNVAFVVLSFSSWLCVSFIPQGVTDFYTCAEDIKQGGEFLLFRMNNIDKTSEHVANQVTYLPMSSKFILLQN